MSSNEERCVMDKQPSWIGCNAAVAIVLATLVALAIGTYSAKYYFRTKECLPSQKRATGSPPHVPFVALHDAASGRKSMDRILRSVLETYQTEGSQALAGLSTMLDEALTAEASIQHNNKVAKLLSTKIQNRITKTAACLEHDETVLARLLGNVSYILALPDKGGSHSETVGVQTNNHTSTRFRLPGSKKLQEADTTQTYDSATQIWAHLVRDWTVEGSFIRESLYGWCCQQIQTHRRKGATVLVPGSGMGRLAYELYQRGYHVEANELSPSMAAAASSIFRGESGSIFPYALDGMANEVDSKRRFVSVDFPDVPIAATKHGSLSYTVGDFVGSEDDYYRRERAGQFDAIVTCFFIDTATNIYEYLDTIQNLLKSRTGVWINVGPVQWHHNALLRPSVDELRDMIEACGWTIQSWSIDQTPVSYRNENHHNNNNNNNNNLPPMTSYDGYRPLRFVARKSA